MARSALPDVLMVGFVIGTGGASTMMRTLSAALSERGVRATIAVPTHGPTVRYAEQCADEGVPVVRSKALVTDYAGRIEGLGRTVSALAFLRRNGARVVHYHVNGQILPRPFLHAERWATAPSLVTIHEPIKEIRTADREADEWAAAVPSRVEVVVCVSSRGLEQQRAYGVPEDRLRLIHNGVSIESMRGDGARVRSELGIGPSDPVLLFLSRIEAVKRPLDVIETFRRIAAEHPAAHLVIAGTGAVEADVARAAAETGPAAPRIHVLGQRPDAAGLFAAATMWILPTEMEAFSMAALEAMAAGCPIVSTSIPGMAEMLRDDENALLVPVGDIDALESAVRRMLSDGDLRRRLTRRAREDVERFSEESMVDAYVDCYESLWREGRALREPVSA